MNEITRLERIKNLILNDIQGKKESIKRFREYRLEIQEQDFASGLEYKADISTIEESLAYFDRMIEAGKLDLEYVNNKLKPLLEQIKELTT